MNFEWDSTKNTINIRKHGIDFVDVKEMFKHPMLTLLDDRIFYNEERWVSIGLIQPLIGVVAYVERHSETIRIISARKATKKEIHRYEKHIKNEMGTFI